MIKEWIMYWVAVVLMIVCIMGVIFTEGWIQILYVFLGGMNLSNIYDTTKGVFYQRNER